jgi:hypothetical protein
MGSWVIKVEKLIINPSSKLGTCIEGIDLNDIFPFFSWETAKSGVELGNVHPPYAPQPCGRDMREL